MAKAIASVGCELPGGNAEFINFDSKASLLDYDVIVFCLNMGVYQFSLQTYRGKPSLDDYDSFRLKEILAHWQRELTEAFRAGATIFVILDTCVEVYADTGERQYSGTGRNRQETRVVGRISNYEMLPIPLSVANTDGASMRLTSQAHLIANYWNEFGEGSSYKVLLTSKSVLPLIVTKSGEKSVGGVIRNSSAKGAMVLLPFIDLQNDEFYVEDEEGGELLWSPAGKQFGSKFRDELLRIDSALRESSTVTPQPDWATSGDYVLPTEKALRVQLLELETRIDQLESEKQDLKNLLARAGGLRRLVYEKGRGLESAIRDALELMGFAASPYKESDSEFDVVFESPEGRFLGEAEGKDTKAVNVDKLRQLQMNLLEDYNREEIEQIASGVLFANGHRLKQPDERPEHFTEKVIKAAKLQGVALVRTPDLFRVAQYLSGTQDEKYALLCREAILRSAGGIVSFPQPPPKNDSTPIDVAAES